MTPKTKTSAETTPDGFDKPRARTARGGCLCGAVRFEITVPACWAWHDHSRRTRHAQGCAYATYVGTWKSRFRVVDGEDLVTAWRDEADGTTRSFCRRCGTPLFYERPHAPKFLNIPRALFGTGVGREPRYHVAVEERPPWAYDLGRLVPLKGYPGVMHQRPKRSAKVDIGELF
jgi:hypothetical protein